MGQKINNEIKKKLLEKQDAAYGDFHRKLVPGEFNIIGVRLPELKKIAKEYAEKDLMAQIDSEDEYYEETMVQGLAIGFQKEEPFPFLEKFIPKIDNWAVCDCTCTNLKYAKKNQEITWDFLQKYIDSAEEYEIRFAAVMMLAHFINDEYIECVISKMDTVKHDGYYAKMAVAWAVSTCYVKYPDKTMKYLKGNTLDDFTYNKALQKITESNRVDKEEKAVIRKMKR